MLNLDIEAAKSAGRIIVWCDGRDGKVWVGISQWLSAANRWECLATDQTPTAWLPAIHPVTGANVEFVRLADYRVGTLPRPSTAHIVAPKSMPPMLPPGVLPPTLPPGVG